MYALFSGRKLVYLGLAEHSLRDSLEAQFVSQTVVTSDQEITGFVAEPSEAAAERYREFLFEFNATFRAPARAQRAPAVGAGDRRRRALGDRRADPERAAVAGGEGAG
ncbi:MAG: hypothetical protein FJZ92_12690, partial [Chloroflexi bacterium]|nr:hypothetical protein [Chloroflexota bacterium]